MVNIEQSEILRYLGYVDSKLDEITKQSIEECMKEIRDIAVPKHIYNTFEIEIGIESNKDVLNFKNSTLEIKSRDLSQHLKNSEKVSVFVATLGISVDKKIKYYNKIDLTKSIIFDACAAAYIEAYCDSEQNKIEKKAKNEGFRLTFRFSPGYGDLSLKYQPAILKVLEAQKKIGLTVTDNYTLIPTKSITAFIGYEIDTVDSKIKLNKTNISSIPKKIDNDKCRSCRNYNHCVFLARGEFCEYRKKNQ